jgi:acetyl-CoA acetyltransferase
MKKGDVMFPKARIPYGTWGSSYFPAWQTSPLAEVNIGQFAGEAANLILGKRKVPKDKLDYMVIGSTVPWHWKFWTAPLVSACLGQRLPGYHMEQACATGLQAAVIGAAEVDTGAHDSVCVLTFDRTSDSPVGVFPERRSYERTQAISDVWDNFGFDPAVGNAMIATAGNVARKYKIDRREVDELTYHRYQQYFEAKNSGFLDRVLVPLEVLNVAGRHLGVVDDDVGVRQIKTHASDGMAVMLVTTEEKAKELSPRPEIDIRFVGKAEVRTTAGMMPEAPGLAVGELLKRTGLTMNDIAVVKNHNPFAVNDAIFAKVFDYDWHKMNNTGCSLVWGHPQGPTLTRSLIEALEEAVDLGGGYVLMFGCAAGDVGIAAILKVSEGGKS